MFGPATVRETAADGDVGTKPDLPCPVCGGRGYSWGCLTAQGVGFVPDDASWLARALRFGVRLRARRCGGCGNVQIFA